MPYDDPILKELGGYFKAEEPGRHERAEAWATAIGLQKVDGLTPSQFLFDTAKDHIEGRITQNQARRRICDYWRRIHRTADEDKQKIRELTDPGSCQKKVVRKGLSEKGCQKTCGKIVSMLKKSPNLTQNGMAKALGISRQAVQKHLARLKEIGRLRRVGPDKGGHWEVIS